MREATGGAYLWMIVITLVFIFACYICYSINYTSAMKVTNSVLLQIQNDEGVNPEHITEVLKSAHYRSRGDCELDKDDPGWTALKFTDNNADAIADDPHNANYCLKKIFVSKDAYGVPTRYYYRLKVFYTVDVPLIGGLNFNVKGDSIHIYAPEDVEVKINVVNND